MSCFDSTHAPVATAARAAGTGLVSTSTRPDIPGMLHLEREARDWSTSNEYKYSYRIILLLLLYVYFSRAHPRFPSKFRRRRLHDFFYLYRKLAKILVGRQFSFLSGKQVHFKKRTFANTLFRKHKKRKTINTTAMVDLNLTCGQPQPCTFNDSPRNRATHLVGGIRWTRQQSVVASRKHNSRGVFDNCTFPTTSSI